MTWYYIIIIYRIWRRGMPFSLTKRSPTPRPGHTMRLGTILLLSAVVYVMTCTTSIPSTRTYLVILLLLLLNIFVALDRAAHSFIITAVIIVITTAIIVDTAVPPPSRPPQNCGENSVGCFRTVRHDSNNIRLNRDDDADDHDDGGCGRVTRIAIARWPTNLW